MDQHAGRVRCQRIGCDADFSEDDNPEGSCQYHDSPIFHDGMKEWSCCKKRSHDFSLFLQLPGCKTGKHSKEKPVFKKAVVAPKTPVCAPSTSLNSNISEKESCTRCHQGFFCSNHGSQIKTTCKPITEAAATTGESKRDVKVSVIEKKMVDINQPQICKNKGCGKTFKEKDNHEAACSYHPGPPVFHDLKRGWKCCDIYVEDFDEFMEIPPCKRGWHNADPQS